MASYPIDCKTFNASAPGCVAVLGRGPYGVAMFDALLRRGVDVVMGVRSDPNQNGPVVLIHPDSSITTRLANDDDARSRVVGVKAAIAAADIIILCIPHRAHAGFIAGNSELLRSRGMQKRKSGGSELVIIDISNGTEKHQETSIAEKLQQTLLANTINIEGEAENVSVVKAFNTVSAYAIGQGASLKGGSSATPVCGDSEHAKDLTILIGTTIGLRPFNIGPLRCAKDMEYLGFSFFAKWGRSTIITSVIFWFFVVYCAVWYMVLDFPGYGRPLYHWSQPSLIVNKALANTSLVLLAVTYLPGKLANLLQLYKRSARVLFPTWLSSWLQIRKQLGLTAVLLAVLHLILTAYIKTGSYGFNMPFGNANVEEKNSVMNLFKEIVLLLGVLAFVALTPVAMSSLPSISAGMTWREWGCIQRTIGHAALLVAGLHAGCYFLTLYLCTYPENSINSPATFATSCNYVVPLLSNYPAYLPPPASISAFLSITVCVLWMILSIPFIERSTWAIRSGATPTRRKSNTVDRPCVIHMKMQNMPTVQTDYKLPKVDTETSLKTETGGDELMSPMRLDSDSESDI